MSWQFTVGLRTKRKADRIVVDAEDALIAALKVKAERPELRRGDQAYAPIGPIFIGLLLLGCAAC
jgi:hypothetical protein